MTDAEKNALHVKKGLAVSEPVSAMVSARRTMKFSPERVVEGIRNGDRSMLARAITLIESSQSADRKTAEQVLSCCVESRWNSIRVGVTGPPGSGKSSVIETLGKYLIQQAGEKVAVLAIDPSSQLSGGSILGDKTRMPFLSSSEMAFVRSTPSRGAHGGVAQHTRDAIALCEAAGFRIVLVETVGVGQAELAVREMVDFLLLVTIPGSGDELQGIKRGVMEIVDALVVNKTDGSNVIAAERARVEAEKALHFRPPSSACLEPRALCCSAHTGQGIAELWATVQDFVTRAKANGIFDEVRRRQALCSLRESLEQEIAQLLHSDPAVREQMTLLQGKVAAGQTTKTRAIGELLEVLAARVRRDA